MAERVVKKTDNKRKTGGFNKTGIPKMNLNHPSELKKDLNKKDQDKDF